MKYRREIDGLRAVAVLPVIFFHAGFSIFSGGYVGVDVFFVISGFLITSILIRELERGDFSISRFYERRARRILPALFFVMLTYLPFAYILTPPSQLKEFSESLISVVLFVSNIFFWQQSGYFAIEAELKPLLHTWSLAVEEQYYLFFPVFLFLIWRFGRSLAFWSILAIALISILLSEWGWRNTPGANFYLAPTRAWELLTGSACAFLAIGRNPHPNNLLSTFGLAMVVFTVFFYHDRIPFPSLYTIAPVAGTALILLFATRGTWVAKLLSTSPFVGIGLISYSAYLWHQPLFSLVRLRTFTLPNPFLMAAVALLALLLAWGTWRWVEKPFRSHSPSVPNTRRAVFTTSGAVGAVFVAFGLAGHFTSGFSGQTSGGENISELEKKLTPNIGLHLDCDYAFTMSPNCTTSSTPRVLLWGDSYAKHLVAGILASDPDIQMQQHTLSACAPILGLAQLGRARSYKWAKDCMNFNNQVLEWLRNHETIDLVILSSHFKAATDGNLLLENGDRLRGEALDYVTRRLRTTIDMIRATGVDVLIVSPTPPSGFSIGQCTLKSTLFSKPEDNCDFDLDTKNAFFNLVQAVSDHVPVYWLHKDICKMGVCDVIQEGNWIYRDTGHLTYEGSSYLGGKNNWIQQFRTIARQNST